jgi:hypothetical protein
MQIVIVLGSVLGLTGLAALLRRLGASRLCPVCAGVAGTWLWLLAAAWAGYAVDTRLPALLLGGSVVGLAEALGKRFPGTGPAWLVAWKAAFLAAGFGAAYLLLERSWPGVAGGFLLLAALGALPFLRAAPARPAVDSAALRALEEQMKRCC